MKPTDLLAARALAVGHGRPLFPPADFSLRAGELVGLLGPNGAGKTTWLKTLSGLLPPCAGEVHLRGRRLRELSGRERAQSLALLLVDPGLPPFLSGWELAALGRTPHRTGLGFSTPADRAAVQAALEQLHCLPWANRRLGTLSDGERQRLCLARIVAQDAPALLLDEPTAHLDFPAKVEVLLLLRGLARREGKAVLASLHDLDLALGFCDRCLILAPDRAPFCGTPEAAAGGPLRAAFPGLPDFWDPLWLRARMPADAAESSS